MRAPRVWELRDEDASRDGHDKACSSRLSKASRETVTRVPVRGVQVDTRGCHSMTRFRFTAVRLRPGAVWTTTKPATRDPVC